MSQFWLSQNRQKPQTTNNVVSFVSSRQEILSDEEAQEVARLLSSKDKPDIVQDSLSGPSSLMQDSSGPVSLNDSLGPPSLQEDSVTEPVRDVSSSNVEETVKEPVSSAVMYDSNASVDVTHDFDEITSSKMDVSYSTCDSGLIGTCFR